MANGKHEGIRQHRGAWEVAVDVGTQPAQRCDACRRRWWLTHRPLPCCPSCGGALRDTEERRQQWRRFKTLREAKKARSDMLVAVDKGNFVAPNVYTLAMWFEEWAEGAASRLRASTLDKYRRDFERYVKRELGSSKLVAVTPQRLDALYGKLLRQGGAEGKPLSPTSVVHVHSMLSKVLADALKKGLIVRNPATAADPPEMPKVTEREHDVWDRDQLAVFLRGTSDDRLAALWRLYVATGCRRGEGLGAKWSDLDLEGGAWVVRRSIGVLNGSPVVTSPKTHRIRTVALDPSTVAALRAHRKRQAEERLMFGPDYDEAGWVFCHPNGTALHPNVITRTFIGLAKAAGLPRIRLHDVRHSVVTGMLWGGVATKAVADQVGHSSTSFTQDAYAKSLPEWQRDAATQYAAWLEGGSASTRQG